MMKIKITCEQATTICTKSQYGEASFIEKIKLNLHLAYCKICRMFSKQNGKLSYICLTAKELQENKEVLSASDKKDFKQQLKKLEKEI